MNFIEEIGPDAEKELNEFRASTQEVLQKADAVGWEEKSLPAGQKVPPLEVIFRIKSGQLQLRNSESLIANFEEGDLVDISWFTAIEPIHLSTDFAVVVDQVDAASLLAVGKAYHRWQASFVRILFQRLRSLLPQNTEFQPRFLSFKEGDQIIEEGSEGTEVYTMVEGRADVQVGSVKVGTISENEIFGAIAALTGTRRTATIIARSHCNVLACSKEDFQQLIRTRPQTVEGLVQSLAEKLMALNKKLTASNSKQTVG